LDANFHSVRQFAIQKFTTFIRLSLLTSNLHLSLVMRRPTPQPVQLIYGLLRVERGLDHPALVVPENFSQLAT